MSHHPYHDEHNENRDTPHEGNGSYWPFVPIILAMVIGTAIIFFFIDTVQYLNAPTP